MKVKSKQSCLNYITHNEIIMRSIGCPIFLALKAFNEIQRDIILSCFGSQFLLNTQHESNMGTLQAGLLKASNIFSYFTVHGWPLSAGFLFVRLFFFWWLKQPSSHILSPRLKLPEQHILLCWHQMQKHPLTLRMGHVMAPQCFLLPPFSSLVSALLREFMGSDKRCREKHQAAGLWSRRVWVTSSLHSHVVTHSDFGLQPKRVWFLK